MLDDQLLDGLGVHEGTEVVSDDEESPVNRFNSPVSDPVSEPDTANFRHFKKAPRR